MIAFRFGTVGSPLSTPTKPGGSIGAILRMRSLNLNALELGWVRSVRVSENTCELIKKTALDQDVSISVHAPYYINLNADKTEWPKSRQRLIDAATFGSLAGATDIVFHPGSYFGQSPDFVMKIALQRLENVLRSLSEKHIQVILRPETMGKSAMLGSLEDTLMMSKEFEGIQPCLDFAHLHARPGNGSMNSVDEWRQLLETYAKSLGQNALSSLHIHLSGIEYTAKGEKNHLPLADSDFNLRALFTALNEFNCSGRILCESPAMENDAVMMKQLWGDLFARPVDL